MRLFAFIALLAVAVALSNAQQQAVDSKLMNENVRPDELTTVATSTASSPKMANSLSERFDFNLDDFEDVVDSDSTGAKRQAKVVDTETTSFEEFTLQPIQKQVATVSVDDSKNIYRVTSSVPKVRNRPSKSPSVGQPTNSTAAVDHSFQFIMELFDHRKWRAEPIGKQTDTDCGRDMRIYLEALKAETRWALEAMDQSGRYRGLYMFGNEMWVGSQQFCDEINVQRNQKSEELQRQQPIVQFYAIVMRIAVPLQKVSVCVNFHCFLIIIRLSCRMSIFNWDNVCREPALWRT